MPKGYPKRVQLEQRNCQQCGQLYDLTKFWKKFCSVQCKTAHYEKHHPRVEVK